MGLIQHAEQLDHRNRDKITKFYKRFLTSEFGHEKSMSVESEGDLSTLIRMLDSCGLVNQSWKSQRGYVLADQIQVINENTITLSGYLKGSCVNPNQIVHITGF